MSGSENSGSLFRLLLGRETINNGSLFEMTELCIVKNIIAQKRG